jgi:CDP-6-deoxy-D-xylo-4-hexulose-3-dehydrase
MSVPKHGDSVYQLVKTEFERRHPKSPFKPGETPVPVTGKVFGVSELHAAVQASLDFWLTSGPYLIMLECGMLSWSIRVLRQIWLQLRP